MEKNNMEKGTVRFASGKKFIESMRHQGLTDEDAIKEFCDNAFDAGANNIWINAWEGDEGSISLSIQDDGVGMSKDLLEKSLAFGETNNQDDGAKIGRFGFGMPTAITSKTRFADVFSKMLEGDYNYTKVDLKELENDPHMRLYMPAQKDPKNFYKHIKDLGSGTIIVLKDCDRMDYKKAPTLLKHITEELGMTYRYFLAEGRKIYVNNETVELDDPLMILKDHKYKKELIKGIKKEDIDDQVGYSVSYDTDPIEISYKDKKGESKKGIIRIKLILLPIRDIWRTAENDKKKWEKYKVGLSTQGFYIVRNNRQISAAEMFIPNQQRHPMLNYFRGEIDFDSVLDDEFGIQVNKTRFRPSKSVREKIGNAVRGVISTIRNEQYRITHELSAKLEKENKLAEEIAKEAPYKTTKKIKSATDDDIKKAIDIEVKAIEKDKDLSEEAKKEKKEDVREIFENQMPFIFDTEHSRQGPIFTWQILGKTTKVILNREHPFYKYLWARYENDTYIRTMLKIFVFTLVRGEQIQQEELEEGNVLTYPELHNHWNMLLRKFLGSEKFGSFARQEYPNIEGYKDIDIEL